MEGKKLFSQDRNSGIGTVSQGSVTLDMEGKGSLYRVSPAFLPESTGERGKCTKEPVEW